MKGQVTTADGRQALFGAAVVALHLASGQAASAVTDTEGRYLLSGLSQGRYRLTVKLQGFAGQGRNLTLAAAGERATEDFQLTIGALDDEITVTASRGERALFEVPQAVTVIDAEAMEERQATSPQEAVERVPNMLNGDANRARARPIYRGLSTARVLILVDGERLNHALMDTSLSISPSAVDLGQLESVEVVGGGGSSLYGSSAIAGTINLITRPPLRPESGNSMAFSADLLLNDNGDYDRESVAFEYGSRGWGLRARVSRFHQSSFDAGGGVVDRQRMIALGELSQAAVLASNPFSPGNANDFSIWELGPGAEVPNGQGEGENAALDLWFYPADRHRIRVSAFVSDHQDLGLPFSNVPHDNRRFRTLSRDYDKLTVRYEGLELTDWLPRVSLRAYRQEFFKVEDGSAFAIDFGSSFALDPATSRFVFTGGLSAFTSGLNFTVSDSDSETTGLEAQLNLVPLPKTLWVTGIQYSNEEAINEFRRGAAAQDGPRAVLFEGSTAPDTDYENLGWFSQLEWRPGQKFLLTAGWRWDQWDTVAHPTPDYPIPGGSELGLLDYAIHVIPDALADFGVDVGELERVTATIGGDGRTLTTSNDVWTGNLALTFFLPRGVTPFVRWASSYREPLVFERYLLSRFGSQDFALLILPNPGLEPEEGESLDLGVRIERRSWRGSLIYFRNDVENLISRINTAVFPLFLDPSVGESAPVGTFQQTTNLGEAELTGVEATFEGSFALGNAGSLSPYVVLSWLEGTNKTPSPADIAVAEALYNRDDTAIRLSGSATDVPFGEVSPFQAVMALRFTDRRAKWFLEYELKLADEVRRVAPDFLRSTSPAIFRSFDSYSRHSLRGGYFFGGGRSIRLTLGLENLTDELYFPAYSGSPGPGRSWILGVGYRWNRRNGPGAP